MRFIFTILFCFTFCFSIFAASETKNAPKHEWSFTGLNGTFDKSAIQSGYKVYREVCAGCHSMNLLYYRDLIDIGFTNDEIKAIASEYTVIDGPNDEGEMFERPAKSFDRFVSPYLNEQEARYSNNGSYPPDLSVITKAKINGPDYIYNLLLGYVDPPEDFELGDGMYYNKWKEGEQIAMAQPLDEGYVDYDDGTENSLEQLAKDVTTFLVWSAEPELEERKSLGIKVLLFFVVAGLFVFIAKNRLWKSVN